MASVSSRSSSDLHLALVWHQCLLDPVLIPARWLRLSFSNFREAGDKLEVCHAEALVHFHKHLHDLKTDGLIFLHPRAVQMELEVVVQLLHVLWDDLRELLERVLDEEVSDQVEEDQSACACAESNVNA